MTDAMAEVVIKSLEHATKLPRDVKAMLISGLPFATKYNGTWHGMQVEFFDLLDFTLKDVIDNSKIEEANMQQRLEEFDANMKQIQDEKEAAEKCLQEALETLRAKVDHDNEMKNSVEKSVKLHRDFEKDNVVNVSIWGKNKDDLAEAERVSDAIDKMAEGLETATLKEGTTQDEAVKEYLKTLGDVALATAAGSALATTADDRHPFDKVSIEAAQNAMADHIAKLKGVIEASSADQQEYDAELLGLWAIASVAKDKSEEAQEVVRVCEVDVEQAQKTLICVSSAETDLEREKVWLPCQLEVAQDTRNHMLAALKAVEQIRAGPPPEPEVDPNVKDEPMPAAEQTVETESKMEADTDVPIQSKIEDAPPPAPVAIAGA